MIIESLCSQRITDEKSIEQTLWVATRLFETATLRSESARWSYLTQLSLEEIQYILSVVPWQVTKHKDKSRIYDGDFSCVSADLPYFAGTTTCISIVLRGCIGIECLEHQRVRSQPNDVHEGDGGSCYYGCIETEGGLINELAYLRDFMGHIEPSASIPRVSLIEVFAITDETLLIHMDLARFDMVVGRFPELQRNMALVVTSKFCDLHSHFRQVASVKDDFLAMGICFLRLCSRFGTLYFDGEPKLENLVVQLKLYLPTSLLGGLLCKKQKEDEIRGYLQRYLPEERTYVTKKFKTRTNPLLFRLKHLLPMEVLRTLLQRVDGSYESVLSSAHLICPADKRVFAKHPTFQQVEDSTVESLLRRAIMMASWLPIPLMLWSSRLAGEFKVLPGWKDHDVLQNSLTALAKKWKTWLARRPKPRASRASKPNT
ncbi:MAG TPA: hypothetical protein PKA27_01760 [Fimbriimonadaceae bacterium]|nr:hypothetical protein [Fimbriimonadaceae bacterium]